jgi:hypothetical protein
MLTRRLITFLPAMTLAKALETTRIHGVAGLTGDRTAVVTTRPCCAAHYTLSDVGLIGGGHVPIPGEVSLAHHAVLFLDELPGFRRHVLKVLRQPLEKGVTNIRSRRCPKSKWFYNLTGRVMNAREASRARSDHQYYYGDHARPVILRSSSRHKFMSTGNFIPCRLDAVD